MTSQKKVFVIEQDSREESLMLEYNRRKNIEAIIEQIPTEIIDTGDKPPAGSAWYELSKDGSYFSLFKQNWSPE
jgi:hypothetical protein